MVADIEDLEEMDASELHARRLNAKDVLTPMSGEILIFPIADGTVKLSGGDQVLRTPTSIRDRPDRGEEQDNLEGSSSTSRQDSSLYDGEAKSDLWSISGDFVYCQYLEPRVKLYVLREASFPIPLKYIDVTRATKTSLDVMLETNIDDYWNVDGDRDLSDTWTDFTRFTILDEKPTDGKTWSGERLTRKQTTSRPDTLWPEMWKDMSETSKRKEKQKWAIEKKRSSTMPENCVVFTLLIQQMMNSRKLFLNARRKLEVPMPAATPCKLHKRDKYRKTCRTVEEHKTTYACSVEADETMRIRMEGSQSKNHEDHIAGKGMNSLSHYNLVHKFIPMPQAMKIPAAKETVDKEWKTRENIGMAADESQKQK